VASLSVITDIKNATRGRLKKEESEPEFHIIEDESPGGLNRSWARLVQRIYDIFSVQENDMALAGTGGVVHSFTIPYAYTMITR